MWRHNGKVIDNFFATGYFFNFWDIFGHPF